MTHSRDTDPIWYTVIKADKSRTKTPKRNEKKVDELYPMHIFSIQMTHERYKYTWWQTKMDESQKQHGQQTPIIQDGRPPQAEDMKKSAL